MVEQERELKGLFCAFRSGALTKEIDRKAQII